MKPKPQTTDYQRLILRTYTQMVRATDAVTTKMHRHLAEHGLTISQFGVLEALYHKGPLCQREIGLKILKTSGNMTTVIDNLEKRALVVREKDMEDRRRISLKLTEKGFTLINTIFPIHAETAEKTFAVMNGRELATLGDLLKKVGKASAEKTTAVERRPL